MELRSQAAEKAAGLAVLASKTSQALQALADLEEIPVTSITLFESRSQRLAAEISGLKARANEIEIQKMPDSGTVDLEEQTGVDDLLMTTLLHESAGPSAQEALDWVSACEAVAVQRCHRGFGSNPRRMRLVWREGRIDQQSYILVNALMPVIATHDDGRREYDVKAGTFRPKSV